MLWILLILIGIAAGTIGGLVGVGGGIITVPVLLYLSDILPEMNDITPQVAVGTSLLVIVFTGLSSTLAYVKLKTVDYRSGFIFFIGSGPGGVVGAILNKSLNASAFLVYFGLFMIFISLILMLRGKIKPMKYKQGKFGIEKIYQEKDGTEHSYGYNPILAILVSFIVGLTGGLFGVGGGALMVPAMLLLFSFPPHIAVATSMLMIFLSSLTSSIAHISLNNIDWVLALLLIPGAWIGGKLGAYINSKLQSSTIVICLRFTLIIIGIRLIYQGLS